MKKLQIGIIGAGRIGKIHAESIQTRIPDACVNTISDPYDDDLDITAEKFAIKNVSRDYEEIIENPQIDAVVICSPTDTHSKIAMEAARLKKHIFCEKPVDLSLEKIEETIRIVKKNKVKMQVGFNRRFDHNFKRVKEYIKMGRAGYVHTLKIISRDPCPPPAEYIGKSGGIFSDMTIHDFDMAIFLLGKNIEQVFSRGEVLIDPEIGKAGDYDTAMTMLRFKNGTLAMIENSRKASYGYDQRIEVFGSNGYIFADNDTLTRIQIGDEKGIHNEKPLHFFLERYMDSFIEEMKQFVFAVNNDKPVPVSVEEGLMSAILAKAAKESAMENKPVFIDL